MNATMIDAETTKGPLFRYTARLALVIGLYALALWARVNLPTGGWPGWAVVLLDVSPALFAVLLVPVVLAFVRLMDEVNRRVVAESCLIAFVVVGLTSFAYAFVQDEYAALPQIGLVWVWPALIGTAGIAQPFVRMGLR